jgi:pyruvate formate lyase activating enzyme
MNVCGLQKTTLLDYPEHLAATIFTPGCNFRCPFCHNSDLVCRPSDQPLIPEEELLQFLDKRKNTLEGICVTGGEPTLQEDLEDFCRQVKHMGYLIKLDTNGYRPAALKRLLDAGLPDYIAMDIKASPTRYGQAAGIPTCRMELLEESIHLIHESGVPYEFRTTVVKGLHQLLDFSEIARWLPGDSVYYIQNFRENEHVIQPGFKPFTTKELREIREECLPFIPKTKIRGE